MQYALLIYYKPGTNEALGADEYEAVHREYMELKDTPDTRGMIHKVRHLVDVE